MATIYKVHPAIGIARAGNSPDEFFVGSERIGEWPQPAGGFNDAQCRVKRQARSAQMKTIAKEVLLYEQNSTKFQPKT